jgi:leader peptidase (prepilin peptidase)/N-methyltransferase
VIRRLATGAAIGGGVALVAAGIRAGADVTELARLLILGVALGAVVVTDLAEHRIPNRIVAPAAVACGALLAAGAARPQQLAGGLAVVAAMLGVSLVSPTSVGMGDVKLALLLVLGLGGLATQAFAFGLVFAAGFGAMLMMRYGRIAAERSVPLAPFLSGGAAVVVLL